MSTDLSKPKEMNPDQEAVEATDANAAQSEAAASKKLPNVAEDAKPEAETETNSNVAQSA